LFVVNASQIIILPSWNINLQYHHHIIATHHLNCTRKGNQCSNTLLQMNNTAQSVTIPYLTHWIPTSRGGIGKNLYQWWQSIQCFTSNCAAHFR
jgi:hypothetical protein